MKSKPVSSGKEKSRVFHQQNIREKELSIDMEDGKPKVKATSFKHKPKDITTSSTSPSGAGQSIPLLIPPTDIILATPSDPTGPNTITPPNSALPTEKTSRRVSSFLGVPVIPEDTFGPFKDFDKHFEEISRAEGSAIFDDDSLDGLAKPAPLSFKKSLSAEDETGSQSSFLIAPKAPDTSSSVSLRGGSGNTSDDDDYEKVSPGPSNPTSAFASQLTHQPLTVGIDEPPPSLSQSSVGGYLLVRKISLLGLLKYWQVILKKNMLTIFLYSSQKTSSNSKIGSFKILGTNVQREPAEQWQNMKDSLRIGWQKI